MAAPSIQAPYAQAVIVPVDHTVSVKKHPDGSLHEVRYYKDGKLDNPTGRALTVYNRNGRIIQDAYYLEGQLVSAAVIKSNVREIQLDVNATWIDGMDLEQFSDSELFTLQRILNRYYHILNPKPFMRLNDLTSGHHKLSYSQNRTYQYGTLVLYPPLESTLLPETYNASIPRGSHSTIRKVRLRQKLANNALNSNSPIIKELRKIRDNTLKEEALKTTLDEDISDKLRDFIQEHDLWNSDQAHIGFLGQSIKNILVSRGHHASGVVFAMLNEFLSTHRLTIEYNYEHGQNESGGNIIRGMISLIKSNGEVVDTFVVECRDCKKQTVTDSLRLELMMNSEYLHSVGFERSDDIIELYNANVRNYMIIEQ
jgi:hypothetical protein